MGWFTGFIKLSYTFHIQWHKKFKLFVKCLPLLQASLLTALIQAGLSFKALLSLTKTKLAVAWLVSWAVSTKEPIDLGLIEQGPAHNATVSHLNRSSIHCQCHCPATANHGLETPGLAAELHTLTWRKARQVSRQTCWTTVVLQGKARQALRAMQVTTLATTGWWPWRHNETFDFRLWVRITGTCLAFPYTDVTQWDL